MTIPAIPYYAVLGDLIVAAVLLGLASALAKADWPPHRRSRIVATTGSVLVGLARRTSSLAGSGLSGRRGPHSTIQSHTPAILVACCCSGAPRP